MEVAQKPGVFAGLLARIRAAGTRTLDALTEPMKPTVAKTETERAADICAVALNQRLETLTVGEHLALLRIIDRHRIHLTKSMRIDDLELLEKRLGLSPMKFVTEAEES